MADTQLSNKDHRYANAVLSLYVIYDKLVKQNETCTHNKTYPNSNRLLSIND